jgi:hypothetical protein
MLFLLHQLLVLMAPLINIVTAFGFLHCSIKSIFSSATILSSTNPASPKSAGDKSSMFVTILLRQ